MELDLARTLQRTDEDFMELALDAARDAAANGEVPIGAVVAVNGEAIAVARNSPIELHDPTAHAEVLALRRAAAAVGNYRLIGATLYATVEPCVMCVGAALQARVARVVFGCRDPKAGALGTVYDLGRDGRLNHRLSVTGDVAATPSRELLQLFFQSRRGA